MGTPAIDLIIVGQGLAGSALAMRALNRHYRIKVFDTPSENRSSRIAAGLVNPITGQNMIKTWMADDLFPSLFKFYREIEELTNRSFFHPRPIYRPFGNIAEQNEWMGKSSKAIYEPYMHGLSAAPVYPGQVKDPLGGITLKQAGYLDTRLYLNAVQEFLTMRGYFEGKAFSAEKLEIYDDGIGYENFRAKKIVFCQGVQNASNPWFKHLPVKSLKGEFLTVQCEWKNDVILNRGVYMVPGARDGEWRVGSTYDWNDRNPGVTDLARSELSEKLEQLICLPYQITGQDWGVRPTTPDRKPILGAHPNYNSVIIFNGFGTKGVSLAPYFSEVLIRWMENEGTIGKEADITRFN
jgi:glycine oxidase